MTLTLSYSYSVGMPPVQTATPNGAAIRGFRVRLGLTCQAVSERIGGRHPKTISRLEYSKDPASVLLLVQVAQALGVEVAEIIDGEVPAFLRPATARESAMA